MKQPKTVYPPEQFHGELPPLYTTCTVLNELGRYPIDEKSIAVARIISVRGYAPRLHVQRYWWKKDGTGWRYGPVILKGPLELVDWMEAHLDEWCDTLAQVEADRVAAKLKRSKATLRRATGVEIDG